MLVPHGKFHNKYKFGLYAIPKGEHVTLHFANVYVDDPSDMENATLFHDLGVTMSKCHVFAIADGNNKYPFHQFIQPDRYKGQLSVSLDMKTVVLTVDHILYDFAGPNDYDFFL